jgi:hypothetical protein
LSKQHRPSLCFHPAAREDDARQVLENNLTAIYDILANVRHDAHIAEGEFVDLAAEFWWKCHDWALSNHV